MRGKRAKVLRREARWKTRGAPACAYYQRRAGNYLEATVRLMPHSTRAAYRRLKAAT